MYSTYIEPIYKGGTKISDSLVFSAYEDYNPYHTYGDSTTYHKTVKKNGKIVLYVIDDITSFSIYSYVLGSWEKDVIDFYQRYAHNETDSDREEALKQLNRLCKL